MQCVGWGDERPENLLIFHLLASGDDEEVESQGEALREAERPRRCHFSSDGKTHSAHYRHMQMLDVLYNPIRKLMLQGKNENVTLCQD